MSKSSSPSGSEIEEKRVTSIFLDDGFSNQDVRKEDRLKSAKAEMGEVKEENERLKMMLDRVEKDYHSLQLRFFDILHKEVPNKCVAENSSTSHHDHETEEEPELVSLCLGRGPRDQSKKGAIIENLMNQPREKEDVEVNLSLGLESKYLLSMEVLSDLSPVNSSEELPKEAELGERTLTTNKSEKVVNVNDDISDQMPAKKARVSVRARCDTPTMNDGCQWRKYGQKIAKGNPCPRAYYRCTVAPACPVRKQVQRCADDLSILITTYEGSHNHPLPVSAAAMASTTSAAASMLLSGSSTSQHAGYSTSASFGIGNAPTALNYLGSNQQFGEPKQKHSFLPPNQTSHLFPTVTVDLTSASNPRFSPNSLSFCSPEPNFSHSNIWGNKGFFPNNGTLRPLNHFQEHSFYHQQCMTTNQTTSSLAETITKAISTDPSLHSVIAAAVSSLVGPSGNQEPGLSLKLGQHQHQNQNPQLNQNNGKGCISGYFKRLSSANSQARNFMLLQPTLPFSVSNSSTSTPPHIVNQINHNYDPDKNRHS